MEKDVINISEIIAKNLKKLRLINELTLNQLSIKSAVTVSTISNIENLKNKVRPLTLRKLLLNMNYSLGLFISKIHDEAPFFDLNPNRIVSTEHDKLLLYGSRKKQQNKIFLIRPIKNLSDNEIIEIHIKSKTHLFKEDIIISGKIWGIVRKGNLLIKTQNQEIEIKQGEEFIIDGEELHNYYSNSEKNTIITAIVSPAMF